MYVVYMYVVYMYVDVHTLCMYIRVYVFLSLDINMVKYGAKPVSQCYMTWLY